MRNGWFRFALAAALALAMNAIAATASFAQPSAPDKVTIPPLLESARRRLPEALVRELDFIVQTSLR